MKKLKFLLTFLLVLSLILSVTGCKKEGNPGGDPGKEPGEVPGDDPGQDPGEEPGDDPGENPGEDPGKNPPPGEDPLAITRVPEEKIGLVDKAVIHLGDLWLAVADKFYRQTDSGDVQEILWAPNGHGLIYFRVTKTYQRDLYYLALGDAPVLLDKNVVAYKAWRNKTDWLWSPDSDALAYAVKDGSEIVKVWLQDLSKTKLSLNKPCDLGPYWLSPDLLVYTTPTERPEVVVINAIGQIQAEVADASLPYPLPEGMLIARGTYDPDALYPFYYTDLVRTNDIGESPNPIYNRTILLHEIARDPVLPGSITLPRYLAMSSPEKLFLKQYAGIISKSTPTTIDLLTQDLFLTFSEYAYPFWFAWAYDGSQIAALPFTLTKPGDYQEQEGYWDLALVDKKASKRVLVEKIYSVSGDQQPVPFQYVLPFNWSLDSTYINYLVDRSDGKGYDWWQVKVSTGAKAAVLEKAGLPEYRPQP